MVDDQIKWVEIVFSPEIELYSEYLNNFFIMIKSWRLCSWCEWWFTETGLALHVLQDVQLLIEQSGSYSLHLVYTLSFVSKLTLLVVHPDQTSWSQECSKDIVHVATSLAQQTKVLSSVAIIGALSDMIRHLRKSIHCSLHDSTLGNEMIQYNLKFETAVEQCLVKLSQKVSSKRYKTIFCWGYSFTWGFGNVR